ncbi:MAG: hypothetical protein RL095_1588 [Verrucomicrobiota bacterium]|jgi:acyl-CoA thioester hydrolase
MGVVYYANYLVWFERCRNEMLRDSGLPYTRLEAEGVMLPVVEAHCDYRLPARYDDLLTITAKVEKIEGCRITFVNTVINQGGQQIAKGYTVHCFMSSASRRPIRPPDTLLSALGWLES